MAFGLRDGLDQMIAAGMPAPAQIRASGGGTASPVWRQILADVLDAEIATVSTTEGAAYGAGAAGARSAPAGSPTVEAAAAALVRVTPGGVTRAGRGALRRGARAPTASCTRRWRRSSTEPEPGAADGRSRA